jgi:hypothetical protein
MGILIFPGGLGGIPSGLTGYFTHSIRHAEDILPDCEAPPLVEPAY